MLESKFVGGGISFVDNFGRTRRCPLMYERRLMQSASRRGSKASRKTDCDLQRSAGLLQSGRSSMPDRLPSCSRRHRQTIRLSSLTLAHRRIVHEPRNHFDDMIGQGTIWVRVSCEIVFPVPRSYRFEDVIGVGDEHEFGPGICML
jgi:hypothetical protein